MLDAPAGVASSLDDVARVPVVTRHDHERTDFGELGLLKFRLPVGGAAGTISVCDVH